MLSLKGIFPPLPTIFNENENLALDKYTSNIQKLCKHELSGFLSLGSNGELVNLSEGEIKEVFIAARVAIPSGKVMLAGTGTQSTRHTILRTKTAAECGADAALVLNPSYYKGLMSQDILVKHFYDVAEAATIPIIIYNMPANSGLDMDAKTIAKIAEHENIIGLKDSGGNITKMGDIKRLTEPEFQILAGSASFLLPAFTVGAVGGIVALSNIAPEKCIKVYQDFKDGNLEEALKTQLELIPINTAVTKQWGVPALKAALEYKGFYGGPPRKPLLPLSEERRLKLIELMERYI